MANSPNRRIPPSIADLKTLLADADIDRVAGLAMSLLAELTELSERIAKLEGADPSKSAERIAALVERTLARQ
jgi:hypothetical protein